MTKNGPFQEHAITHTLTDLGFRLRIHTTQEWHDLYQPHNNDELQRFFDRYTKGIENNWETTAKVRVSLLGYNLVGWHLLCPNHVKLTTPSRTLSITQLRTGQCQRLSIKFYI